VVRPKAVEEVAKMSDENLEQQINIKFCVKISGQTKTQRTAANVERLQTLMHSD
jgi:hypothetical protein